MIQSPRVLLLVGATHSLADELTRLLLTLKPCGASTDVAAAVPACREEELREFLDGEDWEYRAGEKRYRPAWYIDTSKMSPGLLRPLRFVECDQTRKEFPWSVARTTKPGSLRLVVYLCDDGGGFVKEEAFSPHNVGRFDLVLGGDLSGRGSAVAARVFDLLSPGGKWLSSVWDGEGAVDGRRPRETGNEEGDQGGVGTQSGDAKGNERGNERAERGEETWSVGGSLGAAQRLCDETVATTHHMRAASVHRLESSRSKQGRVWHSFLVLTTEFASVPMRPPSCPCCR